MSKADYYETLGVSKNASTAEIKKAYRRMAMKHHPDRNPGDAAAEAKFKEAQDAWDVLSDDQKRAAYDQFGHAGVGGAAGGGGDPFGGSGGFGGGFGDIFGDIFGGGGGGGRQQQAYRGADLRYDLAMELEDAVFGKEFTIRIPSRTECGTCDGSGARPGSSPKACGTCHGQGQVRMQQGFFSVQQTCPQCRGSGTIISDPCGDCSGQGFKRDTKTLHVKIPAGVDTGDRVRSTGNGEPGEKGGPPGDLHVEVRVKEHALFKRDGADLECEVPISFATAALGGEIEVPTLKGKVNIKIPTETQSGKVFRLRGKGVTPIRTGVTGDLFVRVVVEVPVKLSSDQKDMLQALEDSLKDGGSRHSPQSKGWFDSVKSFFDRL